MDSIFPPPAIAESSISIYARNNTACQEHHCNDDGEVKVLLWCQCASMSIRPAWAITGAQPLAQSESNWEARRTRAVSR